MLQLLGLYTESVQLLASLPIIFIGEVSGRTFGVGDELLVQFDMRFAGPRTLSTLKVGLSPTQRTGGVEYLYLTKLIGCGRASVYLLSGGDVGAKTAAAKGWVNWAYDSVAELCVAVDRLAQHIATFPRDALNVTKAGINEDNPSP